MHIISVVNFCIIIQILSDLKTMNKKLAEAGRLFSSDTKWFFFSTKAAGYLSFRDFKTVTGHSSDQVTGKKGKIFESLSRSLRSLANSH